MSEEEKNPKCPCPYSDCDREFSFEETLKHKSRYNISGHMQIVKEELFCPGCQRRIWWIEEE